MSSPPTVDSDDRGGWTTHYIHIINRLRLLLADCPAQVSRVPRPSFRDHVRESVECTSRLVVASCLENRYIVYDQGTAYTSSSKPSWATNANTIEMRPADLMDENHLVDEINGNLAALKSKNPDFAKKYPFKIVRKALMKYFDKEIDEGSIIGLSNVRAMQRCCHESLADVRTDKAASHLAHCLKETLKHQHSCLAVAGRTLARSNAALSFFETSSMGAAAVLRLALEAGASMAPEVGDDDERLGRALQNCLCLDLADILDRSRDRYGGAKEDAIRGAQLLQNEADRHRDTARAATTFGGFFEGLYNAIRLYLAAREAYDAARRVL